MQDRPSAEKLLAAARAFLTATGKCVPSGRLHVVGTFEGAFAALSSQAALEDDAAQSKGEASGFRLVSVHPLAGATDLVAAQRSYSVADTNGTYVAEGQWIIPFWMYASMQYTSSSKSPADVFTSPLSGNVSGAFAPNATRDIELVASFDNFASTTNARSAFLNPLFWRYFKTTVSKG